MRATHTSTSARCAARRAADRDANPVVRQARTAGRDRRHWGARSRGHGVRLPVEGAVDGRRRRVGRANYTITPISTSPPWSPAPTAPSEPSPPACARSNTWSRPATRSATPTSVAAALRPPSRSPRSSPSPMAATLPSRSSSPSPGTVRSTAPPPPAGPRHRVSRARSRRRPVLRSPTPSAPPPRDE